MASEHRHSWDVYTDWSDVIRVHCECGADQHWHDYQQEIEQQLATAKAERDKFAKWVDDLHFGLNKAAKEGNQLYLDNRKLTKANEAQTALLKEVGRSVPIILRQGKGEEIDTWQCPVCFVEVKATRDPQDHLKPPPEPFPHAETCVLKKIEALLGESMSQSSQL